MVERARSEEVRTGNLVVYLNDRLVAVDGQPLYLTGREYAILELLSSRKGTIVTREILLDHLYDGRDEPKMKIIDVLVCKLRRKIAQANAGNHYIATAWGRAYVLRDPPQGQNLGPSKSRCCPHGVKRAGHWDHRRSRAGEVERERRPRRR
jgi:two-component system, cell cycle response regulator CtrA